MNRTLDAKFLILSPNDQARIRLQELIDREYCEIYIINNVRIISPLLNQLEKVILVLNSAQITEDLKLFIGDLISEHDGKIIKIISVDAPENILTHDKILHCSSSYLQNDDNVIKLINELNVWGSRNYIRFGNSGSRIAFFRMKFRNSWRTGVIHDISASGMSCSFDKHNDIELNEMNTEIELCISDRIFSLTGKFLIRRSFKNNNMFVLVFSKKKASHNILSLNSIIYTLTRENTLKKIRKLV